MISTLLLYKIAQLFLVMVIGFVLAKSKIIKSVDSSVLSKISLYLLMPSAIINAFDFEMSSEIVNGLILAFAAAIVVHIIFFILDKIYVRVFGGNSVERASVMYSNAGNLIIPIVMFVLGAEWVVYSTAYLSVQLLFLWTHGINLFSSGNKFNVKKIILNVNIIAIMVGIVIMLSGVRLPNFIKDITSSFGDMIGTVGMLIAGILAADVDFKKVLRNKRLYLVVLMRMVIYPLIILAVLKCLENIPVVNSDKILLISFLASITPSAASVLQFAQIKNGDTDFATAINIVTTVVCVATMPLFVALYNFI